MKVVLIIAEKHLVGFSVPASQEGDVFLFVCLTKMPEIYTVVDCSFYVSGIIFRSLDNDHLRFACCFTD